MKKRFFFFLFFHVCFCNLFAQKQFGFGGAAVYMHPLSFDNVDRPSKPTILGLRGEFVKTKFGIGRVAFSYFDIAVTGFPPSKLNVDVYENGKNSIPDSLLSGTRSQSEFDCIFKFGFEIPQHFNDFLFLNFGIGGGINYGKVKYDLPGFNPQAYYLNTLNGGLKDNATGLMSDEFISAFYEFDKFYLFGQIDGIFNLNEVFYEDISLRVNAGIYYKLNQED